MSLFVRPLIALDIPYLVTDGVAAVIYGEPRLTRDVDVVLALGPRDAERFAEAWPGDRFYVPPVDVIREECARVAHGHFNVIHHETALRADVYLAGNDPLNQWAFERPVIRRVEELDVQLAPLEAVILSKLRYYRQGGSERHLRDIRQMLTISGHDLDADAMAAWTERLGLVAEWERAIAFDADA